MSDWTIKDLIELSNSESIPYVELQCGFLFTKVSISPNGKGMVGYKQFQTIEDFELFNGKDYIRLSENITNFKINAFV